MSCTLFKVKNDSFRDDFLCSLAVSVGIMQGSESMGSEGDDDDSVDSEEGSGDAMAEDGEGDGEGDADMDADSSGAEEMEDLAGDEARAGTAAVAAGVLAVAVASNENIQSVVLPPPQKKGGGALAMGQVNCGADASAAATAAAAVASKQASVIEGGALPV